MAGGNIPVERIEEAKRRLHKFLFVGLLSYWDLSICLFNFFTTGERFIVAGQLHNNRPTNGHANTQYDQGAVPEDHADGEVYAAAVKRFHGDIAKHNITQESCPIVG